MLRNLWGWLNCFTGLHIVGEMDCADGYCWFTCSRCGVREMFATPEDTQRLYDEEGCPELGPLERDE